MVLYLCQQIAAWQHNCNSAYLVIRLWYGWQIGISLQLQLLNCMRALVLNVGQLKTKHSMLVPACIIWDIPMYIFAVAWKQASRATGDTSVTRLPRTFMRLKGRLYVTLNTHCTTYTWKNDMNSPSSVNFFKFGIKYHPIKEPCMQSQACTNIVYATVNINSKCKLCRTL